MIVATNNKDKLREIKKIMDNFTIYSLNDKKIKISIDEDQNTFLENAKKKAKIIYDLTKECVLADDSGLCINVLNGFPGVMTHRFLGENASSKDRNQYLIKEVDKYNDRSAYMICCIVYYDGSEFIVSEGRISGFISKEMRGNNGFGFDEIFELPNGLTLAEMSEDEKNKISARAIALNKLKEKFNQYK